MKLPCVFSDKQIFPEGFLPRKGILVSPSLSTWGWQLYFKLVATELNCGEKRLKINMFSYLPHEDSAGYSLHQGQQDMSGRPKKGISFATLAAKKASSPGRPNSQRPTLFQKMLYFNFHSGFSHQVSIRHSPTVYESNHALHQVN